MRTQSLDKAETVYIVEPAVDGTGWVAWLWGHPGTMATAGTPGEATQKLHDQKPGGTDG